MAGRARALYRGCDAWDAANAGLGPWLWDGENRGFGAGDEYDDGDLREFEWEYNGYRGDGGWNATLSILDQRGPVSVLQFIPQSSFWKLYDLRRGCGKPCQYRIGDRGRGGYCGPGRAVAAADRRNLYE